MWNNNASHVPKIVRFCDQFVSPGAIHLDLYWFSVDLLWFLSESLQILTLSLRSMPLCNKVTSRSKEVTCWVNFNTWLFTRLIICVRLSTSGQKCDQFLFKITAYSNRWIYHLIFGRKFVLFFNYLFYLLILIFVSTTGFDGCRVKTSNINGHLSLHWSVWGPNCLAIFVGTTALVKSKLCLQETLVKETCWGTLLNEKLQHKETRRWPVLNHIFQVTKGVREGVLK